MRALFTMLAVLGLLPVAALGGDRAVERRQMVEEIKEMSAATRIATLDPRVLKAMSEVPRHAFVPRGQTAAAYRNRPLPIGHGQTISQPFIVALMTELLRVKSTDRVLEVGTGSGYQAAVLSVLAAEVYTIEIIPELGKTAQSTLERLGYTNVRAKIGDGYQGWAEHAPFDAVIVTAAPNHVPPPLIEQLKPNGRMVIPLGDFTQELMVLTKMVDGTTKSDRLGPVRFVPLTRE